MKPALFLNRFFGENSQFFVENNKKMYFKIQYEENTWKKLKKISVDDIFAVDNIFGGQHFGTNPKFWRFCPPKVCTLMYFFYR